jgi:GDPmannose 4,6-dehydratase
MLQQPSPEDFVIATGEINSLASFVELAFNEAGLDWRKHVELDLAFLRPTDLARGVGDPSLAARKLNWSARYHMRDVVRMMVEGEKAQMAGSSH